MVSTNRSSIIYWDVDKLLRDELVILCVVLFGWILVCDILHLILIYWYLIESFFYLPFKFLVIDILELSSLFHFIDGVGLPEARHLKVTFELSRTIKSLDVIESSMFGGTEMK